MLFKLKLLSLLLPLLAWTNTWDTENEEEALFLNRIADFWEEGEYFIAKNQIQEFLSTYPESAFADSLNAAVGDLFLREKNHQMALESYAKVQDPEIVQRIFLHKLECLLQIQWYTSLVDACENALKKDTVQDKTKITYYLASALYQQCLNSEGEKQINLAQKVRPYLETLFNEEKKQDLCISFAQVLSLLGEYPQSASIYLALVEDGLEDMLFSAALSQAEYDKELALKTFDEILAKQKHPEALFNRLALLFDLGKYETILEEKKLFLEEISQEKKQEVHLFLGRSYFELENYEKASHELSEFVASHSNDDPSLYAALVMLIQSASYAEDLALLNIGLDTLAKFYPEEECLDTGKLAKALLLKKQTRFEEALTELDSLEERPQVLLEKIALCDLMGTWIKARELAFTFLEKYPNHEHLGLAGKYLIAAATEIANRNFDGRKDLITDLQTLLKKEFIPEETKLFWKYLLAKTYFILDEPSQSSNLLLEAIEDPLFPEKAKADANLVLGLCFAKESPEKFIAYAEKALELKGEDLDIGFVHTSLYNAYLNDVVLPEKAAEHLAQAFYAKAIIEEKNLFWLSKYLIEQQRYNQAKDVLCFLEKTDEKARFELARVHHFLGEDAEAKEILTAYEEKDSEQMLLLGQVLASLGETAKAKELFNSLVENSPLLRSFYGAAAYLENTRLEIKDSQKPSIEVLAKLKNLVLQKNLNHEPIYLEASCDYIELQTQRPQDEEKEDVELLLQKKLALLEKTKRDFESTQDLLSKDYHAGREQSQKQNAIYLSYVDFFEAEQLATQSLLENDAEIQNQLQAKAKTLLLKIVEEKAHPAVVARANQCLNP